MTVTAVVQRSDFESALASAREVGRGDDLAGLNSPPNANLLGRIDEAWDTIEGALSRAFGKGKEVAQGALETAAERVEALLESAGAKAKELQQVLLGRLQRYVSDLIAGALERVQSTIQIATLTLPLVSVEVSQTISLTGSLKVNLTEIINMTAQGQLVVNARYAEQP
jgi:hypothetical protein